MDSLPERLDYPEARRDESVVDNYHGVLVHDPYRWLEDPGTKEVKDFVDKQVSLTESLLQTCETRGKLRERITTLSDHPRYGCPRKRGDKYFYDFNTGLQAQSVLYVQENLEAEAEVLLDPNNLSEDGTVALNFWILSKNAEFLAVGISASGSDWMNIKVIRVADKRTEPDFLSWVKSLSITWTHDNKEKEKGWMQEQKRISILMSNCFTISWALINLKIFSAGKIQNIPIGVLSLK